MTAQPATTPDCDYCGKPSELVSGAVLYPHHGQKFADKYFFRCAPCQAWVGCHDGTFKPLGRLANAELRRAKSAAHFAFDKLWQGKMRRDKCSKSVAREAAYGWLAKELGIAREDCHIGQMDLAMCDRVIAVCASIGRR